jgi:hypothetical protein
MKLVLVSLPTSRSLFYLAAVPEKRLEWVVLWYNVQSLAESPIFSRTSPLCTSPP